MRILRYLGNNLPIILAFGMAFLNYFTGHTIVSLEFIILAMLAFMTRDATELRTELRYDIYDNQRMLIRMEKELLEIRDYLR